MVADDDGKRRLWEVDADSVSVYLYVVDPGVLSRADSSFSPSPPVPVGSLSFSVQLTG